MPRLRNELTGAVMTVEESTAAQLGPEWVSADEEKSESEETPARRGRTRKSDSTSE